MIQAVKPPQPSKSYRLERGELISHAAAHMVEGVAYRRSVETVAELGWLFAQMTARRDWALSSGITQYAEVRIVTKRELAHVEGLAVARSKEHFAFPDGPGLLCLDYDPHGEALGAEVLHSALVTCCPWLEGIGALITASATSYIYDGNTGRCLKGPGGLHTYFIIDGARAAPKAVDAIFQATFGRFGYAMISKSGAISPRTLIDRCSPQPERLFFEAGALLLPPLVQRRASPLIIPGERLAAAAVPLTAAFETWKAIDPLWRQLRADAGPEAAETREAWIAERLANGKISRGTLERAVLGGVLENDFQITLPSRHTVSVRTIRANMRRYEGMQIPDPLEPDYRDGSLCAVIFGWGIFSQAHGGYRLCFERTHAGLDFTAYEPDALDFSIAPEPDRLNFDDLEVT
jgi:hypothetical protein